MANKTIGQLTAKTTPDSADVFALEDTEDTKKINYDALADAILNKITSKKYTVAGFSQTLINAINTLNSNITIDVSNKHTLIPSGSDFNSYTTPGVYYVMSDSDGATMANAPRKSSGKLIVMARHTSGYLAQYYYPSSSAFIRYVRSYGSNTWSMWIQQDINYENVSNRQYGLGSISSASNKTFEEYGLTKYQYGAYFVVLRIDDSLDGTWAGIVRHNSSGYQISEFYKGNHASSPYVTTDGIIKNDSSGTVSCYGLVFPINVWGNLLS